MKKILATILSASMLLCGATFMISADAGEENEPNIDVVDEVDATESEPDDVIDDTTDDADLATDDTPNPSTGVELAIIPAAAALVVLVVLGVVKKKEEVTE